MSSSQKLGKRQPAEVEDASSGPTLRKYTFDFEVPKTKHRLAYEVLKRWWYCMPDWPPANTNYAKILASKGLKEGTARTAGIVREVPGYDGLYFDHQGEILDFRDKTNCPSFDNFKTKETPELARLLVKALHNQIKELRDDPSRSKGKQPKQYDLDLERELESFLSKIQKAYQKMLV